MICSEIDSDLWIAFRAGDKSELWSLVEKLCENLINHEQQPSTRVFFDGIIPELEAWTDKDVSGAGYIWQQTQVVHPFHVELSFHRRTITKGLINIGEEGAEGSKWNSRHKTRWDGLLYSDEFKDLRWAYTFIRGDANWRNG